MAPASLTVNSSCVPTFRMDPAARNIVDDDSRECLAIEVDHGLSGQRVTRVLDVQFLVRDGSYGRTA